MLLILFAVAANATPLETSMAKLELAPKDSKSQIVRFDASIYRVGASNQASNMCKHRKTTRAIVLGPPVNQDGQVAMGGTTKMWQACVPLEDALKLADVPAQTQVSIVGEVKLVNSGAFLMGFALDAATVEVTGPPPKLQMEVSHPQ